MYHSVNEDGISIPAENVYFSLIISVSKFASKHEYDICAEIKYNVNQDHQNMLQEIISDHSVKTKKKNVKSK